jgi:tetratricopeptide (TPR) repeat protein
MFPIPRLSALAAALLLAMAGAQAAEPDAPPAEPPPQSALSAELMYELLVGEISLNDGDTRAGFELILDAARKSDDAALYKRAVEIARATRDGQGALRAAQAWTQAQPESRDANSYLLQVLIGLNRLSDAAAPLARDLALAPAAEKPLAILTIPRYFARAGDRKGAASQVEQVLAPYLTQTDTAVPAWTVIGRMRTANSDTEGALEAARKAQALDPRSEGPALLALTLMAAKQPQAESVVQTYLQGGQPLVEIRLDYARLLLDAQRYPESAAQLRLVVAERPSFAQAWLILGTLELQDNRLEAAQDALKRYVELATADNKDSKPQEGEEQQQAPNRGLTQAYLYLAQIAEQRKDYGQANEWLNRVTAPEEQLSAQIRRASLLARQGKLPEARALLKKQPAQDANGERLKLLADVQLLRDAKQFKTAYEVLAQATSDQPQDVDLLYDQAMLAEKLNRLPDMERLLRQVIAIKPDYHHAYNALGYSLAERNVRLPEAKQLIQKALEYAPDDPFIRDSLGWVEFRIGNAEQAAEILQNAYSAKPDTEIAAHLGEVLWSMGKREQAQAIWREGKNMNADNETLRDTLKRLRVKP